MPLRQRVRRQGRLESWTGRTLVPVIAFAAEASGSPSTYFEDPLQIAGLAMSGIALALVALGLVRSRRARLSKAFLLDSQGTPLKELSLDPRCTLTLADATGNLPPDVTESETKVSGYRIRSVPADDLRLILASRGRITPDHVHYAKFLMISVQGRPEDAAGAPHAIAESPDPSVAVMADRERETAMREAEVRKLEEHLRSESSAMDRERTRIQAWSKDLEAREEVLERAASEDEARSEALAAREEALSAQEKERASDGQSAEPEPDAAAVAAEASLRVEVDTTALEKRKREIAESEQTLRKRTLEVEYREERVRTLERELKGQAEKSREELKALTADRDSLRGDLETMRKAPKDPAAGRPGGKADWEQVEKDRKFLQKWALDLIAHEEAVRDRESALEKEAEKLKASRKKLDAHGSESKASKTGRPDFDVEEARRDIEKRIKILQEKAMDLLQREEKLRKRNDELQLKEKKSQGKTG